MVIALLVATAVLGAKPTFQDVVKKFPAATLPITIKELDDQKVKQLTRAEVDALGFLKDASASLAELREWKEKPYAGDATDPGQKFIWPVAAIQRPKSLVLLIRYDHLEHMYQTRRTFLLSYDEKGVLLGGLLFHALDTGEAGQQGNVSTLDQAGVVSRLITEAVFIFDPVAGDELLILSEQRAKLTSTGTLELMPRAWSKRNGLFVDRKSKEELLAIDKRVFYRATRDKPLQELEGDGNTMRFKSSPKPYILTWNDRRSDISCQNPDGAVQVFNREW